MKFVKLFLALAVLASSITGCMSTGQQFQASNLADLTPGETSLEEASRILAGPPANVFAQKDGTSLVLWAFTNTLVTDALYQRREALLQFGPDGKLMRLVDSTNIRLSDAQRRKLIFPAPIVNSPKDVPSTATSSTPAAATQTIRIDPIPAAKPAKTNQVKAKSVKATPAKATSAKTPAKTTPANAESVPVKK